MGQGNMRCIFRSETHDSTSTDFFGETISFYFSIGYKSALCPVPRQTRKLSFISIQSIQLFFEEFM